MKKPAGSAGFSFKGVMANMEIDQLEEVLDLGTLLGRRQAFALVAGRCSAADADCLRTIRGKKLYRKYGITWEEFCRKYAGISRTVADQLIRQLDEFGPGFFHLASLTRLTAETYRLIASSVKESGVECGGEVIPFAPENAPKLAAAVQELRMRAEAQAKPAAQAAPDLAQRVRRTQKGLEAAIAQLETVSTEDLNLIQRQALRAAIERGLRQLERLTQVVPR
ncbi:MAG: hypothetical protein C5B51_08020 [Terriglobia bacterium]|nr:MAG: hypothetical protein C5B51_08020 [Terriglobia bacterium]